MSSLSNKIKQKLKLVFNKIRIKNNTKYFCIGNNKTGTTSIGQAFKDFGYVVGNQRKAELLMDDYYNDKFETIIDYCKTAEIFQDVPFSCPNTYKHMDKAFPNSKFILTVRDNSEQWYNSLTSFHTKLFGNGTLPTWEVLKKIEYVYPGWSYNNRIKLYNLTENDNPYDKSILTTYYNMHNQDVIDYFKDRPNDLLILNVSDKDSYQKLAKFIGVKVDKNAQFPWKNKTSQL